MSGPLRYFPPLRTGLPKYTTQPYIFLAFGNRRITIPALCKGQDVRACILCEDTGHKDERRSYAVNDTQLFSLAPFTIIPNMLLRS